MRIHNQAFCYGAAGPAAKRLCLSRRQGIDFRTVLGYIAGDVLPPEADRVEDRSQVNADDRRLIDETLAGDSEAFGLLVLRHQDRLYNAVLRVVMNPEDAADAVQEAFINAYQSLMSFKGDAEFFTWLYRIAFNTAMSRKRRKRPTQSLEQHRARDPHFEPVDPRTEPNPALELERAEEEQHLLAALNRLSPEHRTVLVLKDIEGMKYEEIAEIVEVPIGTVRSRIHRARSEMKQLLEPILGTDFTVTAS